MVGVLKNDPGSIKLREEHRAWMEARGEADELVEDFETLVAPRPTLALRLLLRLVEWMRGKVHESEEDARVEARATYEEPGR